jgi:hypothetical protein
MVTPEGHLEDAPERLIPSYERATTEPLPLAARHERGRGGKDEEPWRLSDPFGRYRRDVVDPGREAGQEGEDPMKESTLSKITASVAVAKGMAQKALAPNPNPQWTEYEMQSIDEWIARQDVKLDRPEAIRRLVELGLKTKK